MQQPMRAMQIPLDPQNIFVYVGGRSPKDDRQIKGVSLFLSDIESHERERERKKSYIEEVSFGTDKIKT